MYIPAAFREENTERLHRFIQNNGFAMLISVTHSGAPFVTHLPVYLDRDAGEQGTLLMHVARANPQWRAWEDAGSSETEALVVFSGPHAYVSPRWYANPEGDHVPTWNYAAVHAYGIPRLLSDRELQTTLTQISAQYEPEDGWKPNWNDSHYLEKMARGIVGVAVTITRLEGKWKMSQNQSVDNRQRVAASLRKSAINRTEALETADIMEELLDRRAE